jgi:hypothetical protein
MTKRNADCLDRSDDFHVTNKFNGERCHYPLVSTLLLVMKPAIISTKVLNCNTVKVSNRRGVLQFCDRLSDKRLKNCNFRFRNGHPGPPTPSYHNLNSNFMTGSHFDATEEKLIEHKIYFEAIH